MRRPEILALFGFVVEFINQSAALLLPNEGGYHDAVSIREAKYRVQSSTLNFCSHSISSCFSRELIEQLAVPKAQRRSDAEDLMQLLIEKDGELKESLKIGEHISHITLICLLRNPLW